MLAASLASGMLARLKARLSQPRRGRRQGLPQLQLAQEQQQEHAQRASAAHDDDDDDDDANDDSPSSRPPTPSTLSLSPTGKIAADRGGGGGGGGDREETPAGPTTGSAESSTVDVPGACRPKEAAAGATVVASHSGHPCCTTSGGPERPAAEHENHLQPAIAAPSPSTLSFSPPHPYSLPLPLPEDAISSASTHASSSSPLQPSPTGIPTSPAATCAHPSQRTAHHLTLPIADCPGQAEAPRLQRRGSCVFCHHSALRRAPAQQPILTGALICAQSVDDLLPPKPRHGPAPVHEQLTASSSAPASLVAPPRLQGASLGATDSLEKSIAHAPSAPSPPPANRRRFSTNTLCARSTTLASSPSTRCLVSHHRAGSASGHQDLSVANPEPPAHVVMITRKIWVRRPHASATTILIGEDDLVDDVRDMILRKYANSLGRTFDSPDLNIRICPRDQERERLLGPEETMARTLEKYYPGGQTVDEALIIDIPRRTPKASPRAPPPPGAANIYLADDGRPSENGEGYFPPVLNASSPHLQHAVTAPVNGTLPHSIAVLGTGHIPPIPSPGSTRPRAHRERSERPRLPRQQTPSSSTTVTQIPASAVITNGHDHLPTIPKVKTPLSKSPASAQEPAPARVATPPPRHISPRIANARLKKIKKTPTNVALPANILNGTVPPISVLIVEDNPINLKLLEAFVKRLKVRWQTAMNGRDAVKKWRNGGFHLVLMDIQLPVMNGLDATREIRRLERVNSIGVFSSTPSSAPEADGTRHLLDDQDRLANLALFKSPVIIVALTASSLQSDRHEALAAGCNDFLTKPVNFVWLERKVMEWGCMQALIDFDGWRKWKDFAQHEDETDGNKKVFEKPTRTKSKRHRSSLSSST